MDGKPVRTHTFSTGTFRIEEEEIQGLCSYPNPTDTRTLKFIEKHNTPERSISISPRLKGRRRLEVLIHEALHAEYPSIAADSEEEWVESAAGNISRLLWRMGYRPN